MALLTLAEAKAQLDIETTTDDTELEAYIEALTAPIERLVGPVETREFTETVEGKAASLCLTWIPAVALVSITPTVGTGGALDLSSVVLDPATGIVRHRAGTFAGTLWTVTYTAGRGTVPPTINLAARLLLQHLWRTQYGAARGGGGADDYAVTEPIPGFGYAIPNRVLELLEAYKVPPGVA
ncbi:phage gp6-like head-tail connector protein [Streptomyces sp. NBC_00378]|uniref:head-tail connector protein n=1 Tax=unclassified Streptomyces TaxID=2593676 RepID=UPI00224E3675|nr:MULTISPECIES: head-tail connector protein [unclassified Streptomyces]MCX5112208.1 phage gp6-like head-tail connector protein [Streptomyces sp. NBC_00378]MCX5114597.1 phage gp6-like head-tail connector protein [Streptomyces sp. NBC_00378]